VGHINIAHLHLQASYFVVLSFKHCCQAVDTLLGSSELLGSNVCPSFDGVGKAKGHGSHDLTEFIFAEADEGLHQPG
jgi:hypothetical protein